MTLKAEMHKLKQDGQLAAQALARANAQAAAAAEQAAAERCAREAAAASAQELKHQLAAVHLAICRCMHAHVCVMYAHVCVCLQNH